MSDELITEARWRAAELTVKPDTGWGWATEEELMSMLANDLEAAEARIAKVRDVVEVEKHWNEECGWDVAAITVLDALDMQLKTKEANDE